MPPKLDDQACYCFSVHLVSKEPSRLMGKAFREIIPVNVSHCFTHTHAHMHTAVCNYLTESNCLPETLSL